MRLISGVAADGRQGESQMRGGDGSNHNYYQQEFRDTADVKLTVVGSVRDNRYIA